MSRHARMLAWMWGVVLIVTLLGCNARERSVPAPTSSAPRAEPLATTRDVDRFVPDARGGRIARAWSAATKPQGLTLGARLPASARGAIDVGLATTDEAQHGLRGDYMLRVTHEGLADAPLVDDADGAAYPDVAIATDLLVRANDAQVEWFYRLRDARAPHTFAMQVDLPRGIARAQTESAGSLAFVDATGKARLRMEAPFATDANGTKRAVTLAWDAESARLSLSLDSSGLAYPVLVDPAVDRAVWQQVTTDNQPGATNGQEQIAYDAAQGKAILLGGIGQTDSGWHTWEWDGTSWTMPNVVMVPYRQEPSLTYDSDRQVVVLFGGSHYTGGMTVGLNETWEWDGTSWAQRTTAHAPSARYTASLSYDSKRKKTVLFGGRLGGGFFNDTWEYDGTDWTMKTVENAPGTRYATPMVYDVARSVTLLFSGLGYGSLPDNQTWTWNGTTWTQLTPATSPPKRLYGSMAYDSVRNITVLFGGTIDNNYTTFLGDTWEWDGTVWTMTSPASGPYARAGAAMAYDPVHEKTVLFGGGNQTIGFVDTWLYDDVGIPCTTTATCESGACVDGVCCAQSQCGACQSCALPGVEGICMNVAAGTVPTTGDANACASPQSCTADGVCAYLQAHTCTQGSDCYSGFCSDGVCCESACTSNCESCAIATGATVDGVCSVARAGTSGKGMCGIYACSGASESCTTNCTSDLGCAAGYYCSANGTCTSQKGDGATCDDSAGKDCLASGCSECAVGHCVDGACCATCKGTSELGAFCANDSVCLSDHCVGNVCCATSCSFGDGGASTTCGTGICDPALGYQCRAAGGETACRTESCTNGTHTFTATCDGHGNCGALERTTCAPFGCDANGIACKSTCASDADCSKGSTCNTTAMVCEYGATCSADGSSVISTNGTSTSCSPYLCAGNICTAHCTSISDCATGFVCSTSGVCAIEESVASGSSGGCSCRVGASNETRGAWGGLFTLGAALAFRRRRRRAS